MHLEQGDWFHIDSKYIDAFDGIISLQTLSWLPDYRIPLENLCALNPKWIALTSLFYEGKITYYIRLDDEEEDRTCYYNVCLKSKSCLFSMDSIILSMNLL